MSGIILIGGFIELEELCLSQSLLVHGYIDEAKRDNLKMPYLGNDAMAQDILMNYPDAMLHLTPDKPALRQKLAAKYAIYNREFITLKDLTCVASPSAQIGEGALLQAGVIISSAAKIGNHVKINTGACITHDVVIDDFATIAPRAVLCGHAHIGTGAYIGANSVVLGGLTVGKNAIVGAGAVVTEDVPENVIVVGNPAKIKGV